MIRSFIQTKIVAQSANIMDVNVDDMLMSVLLFGIEKRFDMIASRLTTVELNRQSLNKQYSYDW